MERKYDQLYSFIYLFIYLFVGCVMSLKWLFILFGGDFQFHFLHIFIYVCLMSSMAPQERILLTLTTYEDYA